MESQKPRQPDQKERKRDVMYNPKSLKAEEFISDEEIRETLAYADANKDNVELIDQILAKAKECKGLTHREASVLLACEMPDKIQEMYDLAAEIKKEFYGNRIVLFAPLYLSNYCINGCVYCPYHKKNTHIARKKLTQEEIVKEVTALQDMGHKRLAIEAGEDPENNPIEYILESIKTIYSIKHKNGAIRRVNVNIAESELIFCSRKHITKRATKNCIRRDRNTTMHIIPKLWIVRWKVVSMMWVLVCCLDWSFIVMNLQGF